MALHLKETTNQVSAEVIRARAFVVAFSILEVQRIFLGLPKSRCWGFLFLTNQNL